MNKLGIYKAVFDIPVLLDEDAPKVKEGLNNALAKSYKKDETLRVEQDQNNDSSFRL